MTTVNELKHLVGRRGEYVTSDGWTIPVETEDARFHPWEIRVEVLVRPAITGGQAVWMPLVGRRDDGSVYDVVSFKNEFLLHIGLRPSPSEIGLRPEIGVAA